MESSEPERSSDQVPNAPSQVAEALLFAFEDMTEVNAWLRSAVPDANRIARALSLQFHKYLLGGAQSLSVMLRDDSNRDWVLKIPVSAEAGRAQADFMFRCSGLEVFPEISWRSDETGAFISEYISPAESSPASTLLGATLSRVRRLHEWDGRPDELHHHALTAIVEERVGWARRRIRRAGSTRYASVSTVEAAAVRARRLVRENAKVRWLHGDFQFRNVLGEGTNTRLTDPTPCRGPVEYDLAVFLTSLPSIEHFAALVTRICWMYPTVDSRLLFQWLTAHLVLEYREYDPGFPAKRAAEFLHHRWPEF
jgi:hypothetical protein